MGSAILKPLVLLLGGTSLTSGRLANPPLPWTYFLREDMLGDPLCQGPVTIINTGKGSQTSNFGASQAALMAPLRPTHVLMEDFAINDCAIGPVSIPQATINFNAMVASYKAENPNVIICHQTMSSAAATDASRVNLATYYTNGLANAVANGLESLDNYNGTLLVPGGWPKPLPNAITVGYTPPAGIPAGFAPFPGPATWNPADKSADITLSGANLIATRATPPGTTFVGLRATAGVSAGKYYFTGVMTNGGAGNGIGIGTAAMSLAAYVGFGATSYGYRDDGNVYNAAGVIATYATYVAGDVISVALDLTNNRLWFRKNSGNWNNSGAANPATNVGGLAIAAGTYFAAANLRDAGDAWTGSYGIPGDDLHPIWPGAFQTYSYPNILAWAKRMMADFW